jgi:hypothetical protein
VASGLVRARDGTAAQKTELSASARALFYSERREVISEWRRLIEQKEIIRRAAIAEHRCSLEKIIDLLEWWLLQT